MSDTSPRRRGVRDLTTQHYPKSEMGKLAADGSLLDQLGGSGNVIASAWFSKECATCVRPEFTYMVDRHTRRCPQHGHVAFPLENPWEIKGRELEIAEGRAWDVLRRRPRVDIPSRYSDARLDREQTPAIVAMREIVKEDDDLDVATAMVTLAGPTGVGKTYALAAGFRVVAIHQCEHDAVVFYHASKLTRLLIRPDTSDDVFRACLEAELLAIDDLGGNYLREGGLAESLLEEIITEREARYLSTWVTTNSTQQTIAARVGDRVADRLIGGIWFNLPGESRRRRAPKSAAVASE